MKLLLASALFASATAYGVADPVEVWISLPPYVLYYGLNLTGTFDCSQFATNSAACQTNFNSFNGEYGASGSVSATAKFGSASGSAFGGGSTLEPGLMYYLASFANDVVITGAAGTGTLITQYQVTASSFQIGNPFLNPNTPLNDPQFSFVQGSTKLNIFTDLTNAASNITEPVDITSPFQFGTPFAFGAETQAAVGLYSYLGTGDEGGANSSLQLTGFTVLDASGHVVADAQIIPGQALGTGIFTPEPFSGCLALIGIALVSSVARLRKR